MTNATLNKLFSTKDIYLLNQRLLPQSENFTPFALTDSLIAFSEAHNQPILHFWQLDQTMILGMKDSRVPYFSDGYTSLTNNGYQAVIRNSGGLGVIADAGVLNLSLILPQPIDERLSIDEAYTLMLEWIRSAFSKNNILIEAYEVPTSYCPGTFDLSIAGKKFAGIAQRRIKNGVAVMAYLSIEGNQKKRGQVVKEFYEAGLQDAFGTLGYPAVDPAVMDNLDSLTSEALTVDLAKRKLINAIHQAGGHTLIDKELEYFLSLPSLSEDYHKQLKKMSQRNQQLKGDSHDNSI